jgi:hypothetical protein
MKEKLFSSGAEAVDSSGEWLAVPIKSEMTRMSRVIKDDDTRE